MYTQKYWFVSKYGMKLSHSTVLYYANYALLRYNKIKKRVFTAIHITLALHKGIFMAPVTTSNKTETTHQTKTANDIRGFFTRQEEMDLVKVHLITTLNHTH